MGKAVHKPIDIRRTLINLPLFQQLHDSEIAHLAVVAREVGLSKGQILFQKGTLLNGFYVVVHGQIKLAFSSPQGNEKVVSIVGPGQSFGEAVMFMEKPYVVMAQALTDATLLHIGKQIFFEEMSGDPLFCRKIIAGLAQRLHLLMADVESYSLRSGRDRVVGYLLREEERDGDGVAEGSVSLRLPTSKGTIASRLNLTQEHFSRILSELTSAGLIQVEGRTIHIPDIGRLRRSLG